MPLGSGFTQSPCNNLRACCCRKGYLHSLICSKTDIHVSAWWAGEGNYSGRKDKADFSATSPPRSRFPQGCTEASASTMSKTAMHSFRIPLGETPTQDKPNAVVTQRLTFFSSFPHLSPLLVDKPQMFSGIPQTPTPQSLLNNQPDPNPSKYLQP